MTSFYRIIVHFVSICCLFSILSCANIKYYDQFLFVKKQGQPNLPFEKVLSFTVETKKALTLQPEIGVEGSEGTFLRLESVLDEKNVLIDFKKPLPVGKYKVTAYTKDTTFKVASGLTFILNANGKNVKLKPQLKEELQMK
jgi:hypothetical protein